MVQKQAEIPIIRKLALLAPICEKQKNVSSLSDREFKGEGCSQLLPFRMTSPKSAWMHLAASPNCEGPLINALRFATISQLQHSYCRKYGTSRNTLYECSEIHFCPQFPEPTKSFNACIFSLNNRLKQQFLLPKQSSTTAEKPPQRTFRTTQTTLIFSRMALAPHSPSSFSGSRLVPHIVPIIHKLQTVCVRVHQVPLAELNSHTRSRRIFLT